MTDVRPLIRERPEAMRQRIEPRVEREKKAALGTISGEERAALIREPFDVLEHEYYLNDQLSSGDAVSRLGCGGAIVAIIGYVALIPVIMGLRGVLQDVVGWTLLLALLAVIILSFYLARKRSARYARRKLEPLAARSLKILQPTIEELEKAISQGILERSPFDARRIRSLIEQ